MATEQFTAHHVPEGFFQLIKADVGTDLHGIHGQLIVSKTARPCHWSQNTWCDARYVKIKSIGDAVRQLKDIQRNWRPYSFQLHRRAQLIADGLPKVKADVLKFPETIATPDCGAFTLIDAQTMFFAPRTTRPFPDGIPVFAENKTDPPSRAYLKLWELFTLLKSWPKPGELCLELGASPGGWTWVLAANCCADVIAVDRSPLEDRLGTLANIKFRKGNAFAVKPEEIGKIDWLFSDIVCYPEKLYEFVQQWRAAEACKNFVCTLKFQGDAHYGVIDKFAAIPGSQLLHLAANGHELTWVLRGDQP